MNFSKRGAALIASGVVGALTLSACGGDDDAGEGGTAAAGEGGSYSIYIGEPENPFVPGNTNETEGGQVVASLWTGLVTYDPETNEAVYEEGVAESIESEDQTTWTVTLKEGWTFHDGTPVDAQSFVDAWNYTALSTNAQGNSYFFSNVAGYDDLQAPEGGQPAATEMSGLRVVDDLTFEVTLSAPYAQWPTTTGYTAFFPLPQAFFDDPEGFGEQPVGNGPFTAEEPFEPGVGFTLTRYDDYAGEAANAEQLEYRVYTEVNTAYTDLQGGTLDIVDTIPPDAIASAPDEFGDRFIETPYGDITSLGFPTYDERFADPEVRRAFSMAIDREAITEAIFQGTRIPATSYISPVVNGHRQDACGEACELDVEMANQLLDEAGFDRTQPVDLWFNGGAGHEEWMQAIGNQIRDNLEVEYQLRGDLQFAEYLPLQDAQGMTGPFRAGWIMDYPIAENFLGPLYSTAAIPPAGTNKTFYTNPEFDALLQEGNSAGSDEAAIEAYQAAEDLLVADLPAAPLFYRTNQLAHSERISNVVIDAFGRIDTAAVQVTE